MNITWKYDQDSGKMEFYADGKYIGDMDPSDAREMAEDLIKSVDAI